MAETFYLVQQKNIALALSKFRERALQRHAQRRMRSWRARLGAQRLRRIVVRDFPLAHPAAPRVVARVNQDSVRPGDEARLAPETGDAALHLQEGLLHGVFGVRRTAK